MLDALQGIHGGSSVAPRPTPTPVPTIVIERGHTEFLEALWPLLLTAALALGAALIVQLVVVPRVEARKRREDRWERDVLDLGKIMNSTQARASSALQSELRQLILVGELYADLHGELLERMRVERLEALRRAFAAYDNINGEIDWLASRIEAIAPKSPALNLFIPAISKYRLESLKLDLLYYKAEDEPGNSHDQLEEAQESEAGARKMLSDALKALANNPPPRN